MPTWRHRWPQKLGTLLDQTATFLVEFLNALKAKVTSFFYKRCRRRIPFGRDPAYRTVQDVCASLRRRLPDSDLLYSGNDEGAGGNGNHEYGIKHRLAS
jgi:hypothetical protein